MSVSAAWHDEARALHRDGVPVADIAKRFDKAPAQVRYLVDEVYKEYRNQQVRAARARHIARHGDPTRCVTDLRRKPKTKPARPRIDTMALCRQFARGEFDRAELKRRLGGEA